MHTGTSFLVPRGSDIHTTTTTTTTNTVQPEQQATKATPAADDRITYRCNSAHVCTCSNKSLHSAQEPLLRSNMEHWVSVLWDGGWTAQESRGEAVNAPQRCVTNATTQPLCPRRTSAMLLGLAPACSSTFTTVL